MHTICPRTPNVEKELDVDADCANHVDGAESASVSCSREEACEDVPECD